LFSPPPYHYSIVFTTATTSIQLFLPPLQFYCFHQCHRHGHHDHNSIAFTTTKLELVVVVVVVVVVAVVITIEL